MGNLIKETQATKPAMAAHREIENKRIEDELITKLRDNSYFDFLLREAGYFEELS